MKLFVNMDRENTARIVGDVVKTYLDGQNQAKASVKRFYEAVHSSMVDNGATLSKHLLDMFSCPRNENLAFRKYEACIKELYTQDEGCFQQVVAMAALACAVLDAQIMPDTKKNGQKLTIVHITTDLLMEHKGDWNEWLADCSGKTPEIRNTSEITVVKKCLIAVGVGIGVFATYKLAKYIFG